MKLFALYPNFNFPELEFNHKKYCSLHNIQYHKIHLQNPTEKLSRIHEILQNNLNESCFFF